MNFGDIPLEDIKDLLFDQLYVVTGCFNILKKIINNIIIYK
jgi:hypothetical protein